MKIYHKPSFALFILILMAKISPAWAQRTATIPFDNSRLPSDDLLYQGKVLRADEVYRLGQSGVDLSTLNPLPSAVWSPIMKSIGSKDDSISVQEGQTVDFKGALLSANGLFRFNVSSGQSNVIVHMDKTLHTMLLRKNILRLMGYKVPAIRWMKQLKINFSSLEELKGFILSQIPRATLGAATRWVETINFANSADLELFLKDEAEDSPLRTISRVTSLEAGKSFSIVIRDIALTEPKMQDHYNLAMGTPPQNITSRTLRALILPYALLDIGESANKLEWTVGRISNNEIVLPHFTRSVFTTGMDDARWSMNRLQSISDEQIKQAIDLSYFPHEVGILLFEKIKSRRNALLMIFSMEEEEEEDEEEEEELSPVDSNVAFAPNLIDGKLTKEDWDGYASRFAHGDPESPFKDVHWYAISKLQSIALDNLISRANQELSIFNPNAERIKFILKQFYTGLNHFVQTGEFLTFPISTWVSPVADISVGASRDVVVGNYLGTDNLVQLADSLGWNVQLGAHVGIENVPYIPTLSARETVSISKSWTHLKPLKNLKQAMQEPYKNIAVPLIKWQLAKDLDRIKALEDSANPEVDWNLKKEDSQLSQMMDHLNKNLGVGESLLFMERMVPVVGVAARATNVFSSPFDIKLQASQDVILIRRTQLYRKDAKTIQIYDDVGHGYGWTVDLTLEKFVPLIRLGLRKQRGDYSIKVHQVNLDSDVKENPKFWENANALAEFIQTGSAELLTSIQKPHSIKADFEDKSSRLAILSWRHKKLKTHTTFDINSKDGLKGKYELFTDEKQSGWNWEAFAKDFINLGLKQITSGVEWASPAFQNPSETIMGMGTTTSVRFEASLGPEGSYDERFMRLTDKWEGWSAKVKTVKEKMRKVNAKFGTTIFDESSLNNVDKLKLFNVAINLNLYEAGIDQLSKIPAQTLLGFRSDYETKNNLQNLKCNSNMPQTRRLSTGLTIRACGHLSSLIVLNDECQSKISQGKSRTQVTKCLTKLFREAYEELNFEELSELLGKDNIFVHGSVNGFRNGDEILNDPIQSNTTGRIGGRFWNGPYDIIQQILGVQSGEINGYWLRDRL